MIGQKGVSLVETIVVIAATGFLVILIGSLPNSVNLITKAKNVSLAREVIQKEMEDQRSLQYINLASGSINDPRLKLLPDGSGQVIVEGCSPEVCTAGEEAKVVTMVVTWKEGTKNTGVKFETIIAEGGLNK